MRIASKKVRLLQADLDAAGVTTSVLRVGPKWYEVHVDFVCTKKYRLLEEAKKAEKKVDALLDKEIAIKKVEQQKIF